MSTTITSTTTRRTQPCTSKNDGISILYSLLSGLNTMCLFSLLCTVHERGQLLRG